MHQDLHVHTYRCKHAHGDVDKYCEVAQWRGLQLLGFADHTPLPDDKESSYRMYLEELPSYVRRVRAMSKKFDMIRVFCGMECDHFKGVVNFYKETLLEKYGLDYLIGSVHNFPNSDGWSSVWGFKPTTQNLRRYVDHVVDGMETGLYAFIGHPDMFINAFGKWGPNVESACCDMFQASQELNVPLELNMAGYAKYKRGGLARNQVYPCVPFWRTAADYGVQVVINSDAHSPSDVGMYTELGRRFARRLSLVSADLDFLTTLEE
ncbi:MAG: histidinol-phosphatase [Candidatus Thiodiazotropha sp.]